MNIVRFMGGLGNQMFQYAFMEALRSRGKETGASLGFYSKNKTRQFVLDQVFPNVAMNTVSEEQFEMVKNKWERMKANKTQMEEIMSDPRKMFFWMENERHAYDENVFLTPDCVFVGYWQAKSYLFGIEEKIRRVFTFKVESDIQEAFGIKAKQYYGLHVRRGDYLNNPIYACSNDGYIMRAIERILEIDSSAKFLLFSDDYDWAKTQISSLIDVITREEIPFYKDWYDMYFLSNCKGNIIANSSFSWWAAWLNGGIVIAPKEWLAGRKTEDIWCDNWERI